MAKAKERRGSRKRKRRKKESVLDRLKPEEAQDVLRDILGAHPELTDEAERIAGALVSDVSFESVADEVEYELRLPDLEDLNARSGGHGIGYVEPSEAAWELLDEVMEPYVEDMKRLALLGLEAKALETCKGMLLGLYRVRDGSAGELLGWAPDFPVETAGRVLTEWQAGGKRKKRGGRRAGKRRTFPQDFAATFLPEWQSLIARAVAEP